MEQLIPLLSKIGVLPVVTIPDVRFALPLARALAAGGIPAAEITFRTEAAGEAIRQITSQVPEVLVGAGTVLTREQAEQARAAGARFAVSPGYNPDVVEWCNGQGFPMIPGCATPTEMELAMAQGLRMVKFFPAQVAGGAPMLRAVQPVYPRLSFLPTGGIGEENLQDYLSLPNVIACGGSWLTPARLVETENWEEIASLCRKTARLVRRLRPVE